MANIFLKKRVDEEGEGKEMSGEMMKWEGEWDRERERRVGDRDPNHTMPVDYFLV